MPGFTSIIGQTLPIRTLKTLLARETVPHALLFAGPAGVGKRMTARLFAMALNCQDTDAEKPCSSCRSCKQILAGQHPDVMLIEPKGAILRINQIRELLGALAMKPYQAERRVVILAQAQTMNLEAGNALLKILEEPPTDTVLILTTEQLPDLLPTIVSRCRHVRFSPLSAQDVAAFLATQRNLQVGQAETLAHLCSGSLSKALQLLDAHWQDRRHWLVQASGLDRPGLSSRRSITTALSFAAQLAGQKETIQDLLDILKTWIRDLAVIDHCPEQVVNRDCLEQLRMVSTDFQAEKLGDLWQVVEKAQKAIAANANLRLTLDNMTLGIRSVERQSVLT